MTWQEEQARRQQAIDSVAGLMAEQREDAAMAEAERAELDESQEQWEDHARRHPQDISEAACTSPRHRAAIDNVADQMDAMAEADAQQQENAFGVLLGDEADTPDPMPGAAPTDALLESEPEAPAYGCDDDDDSPLG